MACKLCQKNHNLKNSHIIPEAFYKGIYDRKHRAVPISMNESKPKFIQQGFREKLLCGNCEIRLSKWETILKRDLVDIGNKKSDFLKINSASENYLKVEGIRYVEFKLAILSILWRMSIASDQFFESYELGEHEGKLREILLSGDAPEETKYPIMVSRHELDGILYPGMFMLFPSTRYAQVFAVQSFMIWGHCFRIFISNQNLIKVPVEAFLRKSGELNIAIRSILEFASPESVMSRIYDEQVSSMYEKLL